LGPPLVVPVDRPAHQLRPDLDYAYQRQLEALTRARRGVADIATARKRLELQLQQLQQPAAKLADRLAKAAEAGREDLAAEARSRACEVAERLDGLRHVYATTQSDESRAQAASMRLRRPRQMTSGSARRPSRPRRQSRKPRPR
jgi:phage shock protein A